MTYRRPGQEGEFSPPPRRTDLEHEPTEPPSDTRRRLTYPYGDDYPEGVA